MVEQRMDGDNDIRPRSLDQAAQSLAQKGLAQPAGGVETLRRVRDVEDLPVEARAVLRHWTVEGDRLAQRKTPTLGEGIDNANVCDGRRLAVCVRLLVHQAQRLRDGAGRAPVASTGVRDQEED